MHSTYRPIITDSTQWLCTHEDRKRYQKIQMEFINRGILTALPKFSQTAISNMCVRKCGKWAIPKGSHRMDAYMTREDMCILEEYGIGLEQIAHLFSSTICPLATKGGRLNKLTRRGRSVWENGIVPFAVKGVSEQRQSCQVLVRTFHSRRIELAILQGRDG